MTEEELHTKADDLAARYDAVSEQFCKENTADSKSEAEVIFSALTLYLANRVVELSQFPMIEAKALASHFVDLVKAIEEERNEQENILQ